MAAWRPWTAAEDELVRNYYVDEGTAMSWRLEGRSSEATRKRARTLGVRCSAPRLAGRPPGRASRPQTPKSFHPDYARIDHSQLPLAVERRGPPQPEPLYCELVKSLRKATFLHTELLEAFANFTPAEAAARGAQA